MAIAILALEKDLFFAVKMRDTLRHHGMEVTTVRTLPVLTEKLTAAEKPALVIIDIASKGVDWEDGIRQAREQGLPVLAFGSHMDLEARARALQAGAQKVVANSKFARDMPALITRMLQEPVGTPPHDEADEE